MSRRILVTGASGFIGRALIGMRPHGFDLIALSRRRPVMSGIEWRSGLDLSPNADWQPLLGDVDAIVHLAGRVHMRSDADSSAYFVENAEGSIKLARDAIAAGVRRFIFLSTSKVLGDESGATALDESSPPRPTDGYAASKLAAERELTAMRDRLDVTILRPPVVYGPGVRANFLALMSAVTRGVPLPLASINNRRSLVGVGNLASAIVASLASDNAIGKIFHVTDGTTLSTPDLVRSVAAAVGARARLFGAPPALLELLGSALGRGETVRRLTRSLELDDRAIREELGWRPPRTFEQGLAETARWFCAR